MQKEKTVKTSLRLPEELWKRTKIRAIEMNIEAQQLVRLALEKFLKEGGRQHDRFPLGLESMRKSLLGGPMMKLRAKVQRVSSWPTKGGGQHES